jgi:radical SAM superfamily enzyme YgiQ (UPF0313 family)
MLGVLDGALVARFCVATAVKACDECPDTNDVLAGALSTALADWQEGVLQNTRALLVFPRFGASSFWALRDVCAVWGAKCPAPPLGLITVAALLPPSWSVRLVDCNVEALLDSDIDWADIVLTGGMLPQRPDTLKVMARAQGRGKPVAVGGPDAMSSPEAFQKAEFVIVGEAEAVLSDFARAWDGGSRSGVFTAEKFKVDIRSSPIPRFELLKFHNYLYVGVQFSRGCPFNCEFCDIIELFGRVPRSKTTPQMLAELQALYDLGYRGHVDFVDDNLIGNKRALKQFLPHLAAWQKTRGYPFQFSTEASLNLADDAQLLGMMSAANFFAIFTGIESPDTETLVQAQKKQNTRRDIADSVHRIYAAGMFVIAGFIVGFDTERDAVDQGIVECIEATGIPVCMAGLLTALPNTQLSRRLEREGRLLPLVIPSDAAAAGDQCTAGLNFVTLRPREQVLSDYRSVLATVYRPADYFARVRRVGRLLRRPKLQVKVEGAGLQHQLGALRRLIRLSWRPGMRWQFWRTVADVLFHNPAAFEFVLILCAFYLHLGPFSRFVIGELDRQIAEAEDVPMDGRHRDARGQAPRRHSLEASL